DEIEAEVLADLADPAAWDEPIDVPPSKAPRLGWVARGRHLELAARFHVLSILHRLGAEASLTNSYRDSVDVTVVQAPGRAATLDVKTLVGTNTWFVEPFPARKNHYVTFVVFPEDAAKNPDTAPDVLVFPSVRLKELLGHETGGVNVRALARELRITDPWQKLITQAA
ncbi:MAG: hypothetical protein QOH21_1105, partial [Acidobacteriota bacterium]|nr:hypothetical protein [Acidobacteriota bacterium]